MKKFVSILLALTMILTLTACGGNQAPVETKAPEAAAAPAEAGVIHVGIINNDPNESGYRTANVRDMEETFTEANGYKASTFYSLKNDEQIAAAQKFIQDEVDYLLISAAATTGWDNVLMDAEAAGIPVILFDRTIDADESLYVASIVSDMAKEGQTAVDWLASQNKDAYNVIHIQGVMGSAAQIGRTGALDEMVAANDNWTLVTQQTAEWNAENAQQIVQSVIPGMTIICPADGVETEAAVKAAYEMDGPVYLRFGRLAVPQFHEEGFSFQIGKGEILKDGSDVAIIANGLLVYEAIQAGEILAQQGIRAMIINMATVKPLDEALVLAAAKKCGRVITCEEHSIIGGLGEAVAALLGEKLPTPIRRIGVNDEFGHSGPAAALLKQFGLSADHIVEVAVDFCKE